MQDRQSTEPERSASKRRFRNSLMLGLPLALLAAFGGWQFAHRGSEAPASAASTQMSPATLADFRGETPSADARLMANWIVTTHDNAQHAFVLVDKKDARVYVFTPDGHLKDSAPALMGAAHGDDIAPGTGDKPLSEMGPQDKITPTGRFVAKPGENADDEDVIWVDYDDAISMHRVRPHVAAERRLERLASRTIDDNRISFGCINLPVTFYEDVARPTVKQYGGVVYVLPETRTVQQEFGAYDVTDPRQVAAAQQRATAVAQHTSAPHA